jgi:superfamily II DNA or RNA helicase
MIAHIHNDVIRIYRASDGFVRTIETRLSYVDKSKQYQMHRMRKSIFSNNSFAYNQLAKEVEGNLVTREGVESGGVTFTIPAGFAFILKDYPDLDIKDMRKETGATIALPWANKTYSFQLRDYQEEALLAAQGSWRGIINFATGLGKTKTSIALLRNLKKKALIVCPGKKLANQFKEELEEAFGANKIGFIGDGKYKPGLITVGIAQSVSNKAEDIKKLDLGVVIFDETHHTPATTFYSIAQALGSVGRMYGLTATAYRADGKDVFITAACGDLIAERDVAWGVNNKWLAQPYFIVRSVPTTGTDFKDDKLRAYKAHVLKSTVLNDRIVSDISAMVKAGKSTLVLVDQIEHGNYLSSNTNLPFANGKDKGSDKLIDALNAGKIKGLIATDGIVGEGIDTRNVDCLVLVNFNASKVAVMQAVGRGLRKTATKDKCIILDYIPAGSTMLTRHANQRIGFYREITHNVKIV